MWAEGSLPYLDHNVWVGCEQEITVNILSGFVLDVEGAPLLYYSVMNRSSGACVEAMGRGLWGPSRAQARLWDSAYP